MNQTLQERNPKRGAVVTGAVAAVCWATILPLNFYLFQGMRGSQINHLIMFILACMGFFGGAVIGGIVGAVAASLARNSEQPAVARPLWGALIGAGIVLLACGNGTASLPLPLLLLGGALPGFLGGIAGTQHRRSPPAPSAQG